jgi:hypothetical protein
LRVSAASSAAIELEWTEAGAGEGGFELQRAESGDQVPGEFRGLATLPRGRTRFVDRGVSPARSYWYRVRAASSSVYSENLRVFVGAEDLVISELRPAFLPLPRPGDRYYADMTTGWWQLPELTGASDPTVNDEARGTERFLSVSSGRWYTGLIPGEKLPGWLEDWRIAGRSVAGRCSALRSAAISSPAPWSSV